MHIVRIGSLSTKNMTAPHSGRTQPTHFVVKNSAFDVELAAQSVDLTALTLECELVYDAASEPYKAVDFATKERVLTYTAQVARRTATLAVRVGVLSSQLEGALFRLRITGRPRTAAEHSHTVSLLSSPLTCVSKPYLCFRADGDKGKPKPTRKRVYEAVSRATVIDTAAGARRGDAAGAVHVDGGALLGSIEAFRTEQAEQRQMLQQLLRNQQTSMQTTLLDTASNTGKRARTDSIDSDSDDDASIEADRAHVEAAAARRLPRRAARPSRFVIDNDDDEDKCDDDQVVPFSSSSVSSVRQHQQQQQQPPRMSTNEATGGADTVQHWRAGDAGLTAFPLYPLRLQQELDDDEQSGRSPAEKRLLAAADELAAAFGALGGAKSDDARQSLRRAVPQVVLDALAPSAASLAASLDDDAAPLFLDNTAHIAAMHERDAANEATLLGDSFGWGF